jgi:hypothetical protein
MGAALHSSLLQQRAEMGPGCVLLLQQVSVFTPSPGTTYAAVTAGNIVRVSRQHSMLCLAQSWFRRSAQISP